MKGSLAVLVLAGAMLLPPAALADVWEPVSGTPPTSLGGGTTADIQPDAFRAYTLDDDPVAAAPAARSLRASTVLTLPAPDGSMQRFEVTESPIMEPGLAARHPEITTYAGRGIDDPAATIRADQTPLGFHASVRSPDGAWYVDPYYHLDDSVYITYYGRDVSHDPHGGFVEQELDEDTDPLALAAVPQGPEVMRRHLPARAPHRPRLLDLLRRPAERHGREGDADEPRQPDLRGRDRDPARADRRQRQAEPQHAGAD